MGDTSIYNLPTLCLKRTLPSMDFMDVIMEDIPTHNLTTLCLNGALPCVDFMDVIMGDIPETPSHHTSTITTLILEPSHRY